MKYPSFDERKEQRQRHTRFREPGVDRIMPFLTEAEARVVGEREEKLKKKAAGIIIRETAGRWQFDIFLSHAILDETLVLGAMRYLENAGLTVYVDWIVDPQLDRNRVTKTSSERLRKRMQQSKATIFLWSKNAAVSKWMPWELGYFDALRGKIAVMPLVSSSDVDYTGSEYLSLYPTADFLAIGGKRMPYVSDVPMNSWFSVG